MDQPSDSFQRESLEAHNSLRALHGSPPLEWSEDLAKGSLAWVKELASSNLLAHGDSNDGENIAYIFGV